MDLKEIYAEFEEGVLVVVVPKLEGKPEESQRININ
ncbi:Hsp20 family protein [Salmonella enterica]